MDVLLFGGTSEGRQLAEWLDARGTCDVVLCVATDYGASLVDGAHVESHVGALTVDDKRRLVADHDFCCAIDATHPYAQHISHSVEEMAAACGLDLVRVERDDVEDGPWTSVTSAEEAARTVAGRRGNVLLTTGTKDLAAFVGAMPDFAERLYVRVLPVRASLERVWELGIPTRHVIAMQGPFSSALNRALIDDLGIRCLVSKRSGAAGGFLEKVQSALDCGIEIVVIERPCATEGLTLDATKALLEARYGI